MQWYLYAEYVEYHTLYKMLYYTILIDTMCMERLYFYTWKFSEMIMLVVFVHINILRNVLKIHKAITTDQILDLIACSCMYFSSK